ncbi:hypothetical protein U91I_02103 [alpha proteobacterium U9-1i]|nr:hypothetical protein U91I_02103 [alpha proteobacterium U9-1i]
MRDKAKANRLYASMTAGVLASVALLSFGVWYFRPPLPDPETLCPTNLPLAGHTLVIVDRTDRWNPTVAQTLTELIESAQRDTERYQKFSIVALDSSMTTRPIFSVCNPGEPNFMTDLYRGRRFTQRDFDEKFVDAAENVVATISAPGEAQTSPIVEYAHRWLGRDDFNETIPNRRMILISDMRQNSPRISVYDSPSGEDLARVVEQEFGESGRTVSYDVYFVAHGHDANVPESTVRNAWDAAFRGLSATYEWRQLE